MAKISNKLFDIIRNLKADAVPRSPRSDNNSHEQNHEDVNENINTDAETTEDVFIEPDELKKEKKKSKFKNTFFKPNNKDDKSTKKRKGDKRSSNDNHVNTQASGNVINIVNSPDFHWGNNFIYHLGTNNKTAKDNISEPEGEDIPKCNLINQVLEAKIKPEHDYIDYVSKNLGKNWRSFFRSLGYTTGRIETVEIDEAKNGVSEARYKLLLDWIRNDDVGTLGRLATLLWEEGEKQIVKELAIIYKSNKK